MITNSNGAARRPASQVRPVAGAGSLPLAQTLPPARSLPSVVREGLVRVRHAMRVLAPLDRDPAIVGGVEQFAREPLLHRVFRAPARAADQPADRQRLAAVGANLD